jgi:hypothetical protein
MAGVRTGSDRKNGSGIVEECRFIKANGLKCQSPAMRGSRFCYFHGRARILSPRPRSRDQALKLPRLVNSASISVALNEILQALASGSIDTKRAGNLLYALQMAQQNLPAAPPTHLPQRPGR